jgi:hypothetical protein
MIVKLNEVEQKLAIFLAKKRHQANRSSNTTNRKIGGQSDEQTDLEGVGAEIAYCKIMNVYPDMDLDHRPPDDATLSDGRTVDVKATRYKSGRLVVVPWKKAGVDLFALMVGEFPEYRLAGTKPADEVIREDRLGDLGHGKTYMVEQKDLDK